MNSLAFEAKKAIIAKNFDFWITSHTNEEIYDEFNRMHPQTQCTKIITMGQNKQLLKIIFSDQEEAKLIAKNRFTLFHVRVPPYNIVIDEFIEVPMCMKCYVMNDLSTRRCTSTTVICSECSQTGHTWTDCKTGTKMCINCSGNHRTTAPQCPKRKEEAAKIRRAASANQIRAGTAYSSVVTSNLPARQNVNNLNENSLIINEFIYFEFIRNFEFF